MPDLPSFEEVRRTMPPPELVDSHGEVIRYLSKPNAAKDFNYITQDNVLSFLSNDEVTNVAMNSGTIELLKKFNFSDTCRIIQTEISTMLATARSRGGFASKLLVTNIIEGGNTVPPEAFANPNIIRTPLGARH